MKIRPTFTAQTAISNFAPWMIYGILAATGHPTWAYAGGLVVALCLGVPQWRAGRGIKILDGAGLLFFLSGVIFTTMLHSSLFTQESGVVIWAIFAVVAWGSLLFGSPFTAQYARESVPKIYWNNPGFRRVNVVITAVWGTVFVLNTALATATSPKLNLLSGHAMLWLQAGSFLSIGLGILFTNHYPQWVTSRQS